MATKHLLAIALATAGCGGLSNDDLRFLRAVPDKDVAVRAPGAELDSSGQTLRQGLIGRRAKLVDDLGQHARNMNHGLLWVTRLVDAVARRFPPTVREEDLRIWGPHAPKETPGLVTRLVIERRSESSDEVYAWSWQFRRAAGAEDAWSDVFSGDYRGRTATRGVGTVVIDFAAARALGMEKEPVPFDRIFYTYDRSEGGRALSLEAQVEGATGAVVEDFEYAYLRRADGSGQFSFAFRGDACCGARPERLEALTRWVAENGRPSAGRADVKVSGGDLLLPYTQVECWDRDLGRVYFADSAKLTADEGDLSLCAFGPP